MILGDGGISAAATSSAMMSADPRPVLIVTGLVQEAKIAAGPGMTVICSSSDPVQLRSLLADIDPRSIRGVISFGVAGGLDPALRTGTVVLATEVVAAGQVWCASEQLSAELLAGSGVGNQTVVRGGLVGVEKVVTGQAGKAALRSEFGASAVDMESHIAAEFAALAGLPFAALRVVSDPATRALPEIATTAIKPNGDVDLGKVLRGIARNPLVIRALVSTGRDFNRALRSLKDCRSFLLSRIGLASAEA